MSPFFSESNKLFYITLLQIIIIPVASYTSILHTEQTPNLVFLNWQMKLVYIIHFDNEQSLCRDSKRSTFRWCNTESRFAKNVID